MTKRQQIMDALGVLLNAIGTLTGGALEWNKEQLNQENLPAAVYKDATATGAAIAGGTTGHSLEINIDFGVAGADSTAAARELGAEILAAFGTDPSLGGLLDSSSFSGFDLTGPEAGIENTLGRLTLALKYETSRWQL